MIMNFVRKNAAMLMFTCFNAIRHYLLLMDYFTLIVFSIRFTLFFAADKAGSSSHAHVTLQIIMRCYVGKSMNIFIYVSIL